MKPRNRFQGMNSASLCSLAGRYDNPIPTRFLAPIDCLKSPALVFVYMVDCKKIFDFWLNEIKNKTFFGSMKKFHV
jgi:hypothetical protein